MREMTLAEPQEANADPTRAINLGNPDHAKLFKAGPDFLPDGRVILTFIEPSDHEVFAPRVLVDGGMYRLPILDLKVVLCDGRVFRVHGYDGFNGRLTLGR